jgi:kynureninase
MLDPHAYRPSFDSLAGCCHLISNSLGAMPNRARECAAEYTRTWQEWGVRAWAEAWWELPRTIGDCIGALVNADPDTVSMHLNVTSAQATIQSCFDLKRPRNKVVMMEMEFPSILYIYREWLRGRGELVLIPSDDGVTLDAQHVIDAIDERTLLVPISHVLFRSSHIMDAKRIIERAHQVGALVVLDIFQSLGTVPLDVKKLDVDFAVGGCLKWLCGGPGACFLYVRPDLRDTLRPRFTGWMAHQDPFAFDIGDIEYTTGSYRFMNGTPNIPALYTCRAGLNIIADIGIGAIRERSSHMTSRVIELARERGWTVNAAPDPSRRAGTVAIDVPHACEVAAELNSRNVLVDYRPKAGIRIAPHFYNTDDEIVFALAQVGDILGDGSWKKHISRGHTVT